MGKFIDIKFLPAPRNDGGGQASGRKLKSMAMNSRDEKPGYEGVFSGRPLERQEVVEILDVWDRESSWRAKEESPDQEQVHKLLDGLCDGAGIDLFSLAVFKNQFQLDNDFLPAPDGGVMRMALFLVPLGTEEASFARGVIDVLGPAGFTAGWGLQTSDYGGKTWRVLLVLSNMESVAQSEGAMARVESSLNAVLEPAKAQSLLHHIKWKNPLAQAGLAVSGGMNQS
ncbi:hypothetical protein CDEST_05840 [Colletotrichum destructivum]|uniref:Uncharacterized protein n=1 Tax=Colletotrichum destructivum TaxID=34406 RepID=A0AAX4IBU4_9PEZI|nr:hypothetical protein CDEST_05840 [Colletotrichum destructivum]